MSPKVQIVQNWFSKKPSKRALEFTLLVALFFIISGNVYISGLFQSTNWMPVTPKSVFAHFELWRLWTALFAHSDLGHLMNNAVLFLPLTYLLIGYFGVFLFPVMGILVGGLINLAVLRTMPYENSLVGMSGVVYWMGAVWLTLFVLIDTRKTTRRRISIALFVAIVLFAPQAYKPEISYLSHLLGFLFGTISGLCYYVFRKSEFKAEERFEEVLDEPEDNFRSELNDARPLAPETSKPRWLPSDP